MMTHGQSPLIKLCLDLTGAIIEPDGARGRIIEIENTSAIHFLLWLGGRKFKGGVFSSGYGTCNDVMVTNMLPIDTSV